MHIPSPGGGGCRAEQCQAGSACCPVGRSGTVPGGAWAAAGQPCRRAGGKHIPPLAAGQADVRLEERDPQSVLTWQLPPWSSWAGRGCWVTCGMPGRQRKTVSTEGQQPGESCTRTGRLQPGWQPGHQWPGRPGGGCSMPLALPPAQKDPAPLRFGAAWPQGGLGSAGVAGYAEGWAGAGPGVRLS